MADSANDAHADRDEELAPLRRATVADVDAQDGPDKRPDVEAGREVLRSKLRVAESDAAPQATPPPRFAAPDPSDGPTEDRAARPILRGDVYRHRVVDGREHRDTLWRRIMVKLRELSTSKGEREEQQLDARLRRPAPVSRLNVVAVVSPKGGVGKTTTTWLVGDALARIARVPTVAIDANPDYGTLGHLVEDARRADRSLSDLLADYPAGREAPNASELRPYLSATASGLRVLEAPVDPDVMASMGSDEYERLLALVSPGIEVVVLDCGTGLASPLARWAMKRADRILIVTTPDWVTTNNVSAALKVVPTDRAALVLNQVRTGAAGDRDAITDHFARAAVEDRHTVPYDEQLRTMLDSGTYDLDSARRPMRLAIKRLAAQVGEGLR